MLLQQTKAQVLEYSEQWLRSEQVEVQVPAVVVLNKYRSVKWKRPKSSDLANRNSIFLRDDGICQYCGAPGALASRSVPESALAS